MVKQSYASELDLSVRRVRPAIVGDSEHRLLWLFHELIVCFVLTVNDSPLK